MIRLMLVCLEFLIVAVPMSGSASAITVELAKTCQALTAKAFPPRVIGNPAAGSAKGSSKDQQAYYKKCISNDGKVDYHGSQEVK
jgi:hypothetical protein